MKSFIFLLKLSLWWYFYPLFHFSWWLLNCWLIVRLIYLSVVCFYLLVYLLLNHRLDIHLHFLFYFLPYKRTLYRLYRLLNFHCFHLFVLSSFATIKQSNSTEPYDNKNQKYDPKSKRTIWRRAIIWIWKERRRRAFKRNFISAFRIWLNCCRGLIICHKARESRSLGSCNNFVAGDIINYATNAFLFKVDGKEQVFMKENRTFWSVLTSYCNFISQSKFSDLLKC